MAPPLDDAETLVNVQSVKITRSVDVVFDWYVLVDVVLHVI